MSAFDVSGLAPRLFAVVQSDDEEQWVAAWGMEFEDHAEVAAVSGEFRMLTPGAVNSLKYFEEGHDITTTLVWVNPAQPGGSALP
ncbi:hypothetical protein [Saccharothrix sp.]|uniref:hypothetical protein n=1 Tax=Saccharothrix sp. TaxID=1873460 RepID=UPI00281161B2|nr:hypothetical protein [Saccharothrix sp.]